MDKTENKEFKPYIPASKIMPEFTLFSVILGMILAVIFAGANAYLGLRVGMTVSASIPAAVISMGIVRVIFKRSSILENNIVQTISSAGESVAAGVIFTTPALFMWAKDGLCDKPSMLTIGFVSLAGGVLGVLMMIPLRAALIVKEHGVLKYPEGQACAEVLMAGEKDDSKSSSVFKGLGIAALYKFVTDGLKVFPSEISWNIKKYKGAGFGFDVLPALVGVGYICGADVSRMLFAGGMLSWFILMPMIVFFGSDKVLFPVNDSISNIFSAGGADAIWGTYIRYIGAGALAAAGIISLIKSLPMIMKTFASASKSFGKSSEDTSRTNRDLSMKTVLIGCACMVVFMWLYPGIPVNIVGSLIILIFGFFFATVASKMVGLIGSSNNPVSGMAIATLLLGTLILKVTGTTGMNGMIQAITIGSVICVIVAISGDTSQDLKTGYLLGSTPKKQQIGEIIGVLISSVTIGAIMYLLDKAWGFGSAELGAPQASMMKLVVEGVMEGNLPWGMIIIGVSIAVLLELFGLPALPVAIGIYLPIYLSSPIMVGGIIRYIVEKRKYKSEENKENAVQSGVLYTSGLIAGEGIIGILLAVAAVIRFSSGKTLAEIMDLSGKFNLGKSGAVVFFALISYSVYYFARKGANVKKVKVKKKSKA